MSDIISDKSTLKSIGVVTVGALVRKVLLIAGMAILSVTLIAAFVIWNSKNEVEKHQNGLIIMDQQGNIGQGHLATVNENEIAKIQCEATIKIALSNMFGFNGETFDQNMKYALPLFDNSGRFVYESYLNDKVQAYLTANDIEVECIIDSINVEAGFVSFRQEWRKQDELKVYNYLGSYGIQKVPISKYNTYGIKLLNWKYSEVKVSY